MTVTINCLRPQTKLVRTTQPRLQVPWRIRCELGFKFHIRYTMPQWWWIGIDFLSDHTPILILTINVIQSELPQEAVGMAGRNGKAKILTITAQIDDTAFLDLTVVGRNIIGIAGVVFDMVDSRSHWGVIDPEDDVANVAQQNRNVCQTFVVGLDSQGVQAIWMISGVPDDPEIKV